jgi:hypothetical protein
MIQIIEARTIIGVLVVTESSDQKISFNIDCCTGSELFAKDKFYSKRK